MIRDVCAWLLLLLMTLVAPGPGHAQQPPADWFARVTVPTGFSLAPDGRHLAQITTDGDRRKVRLLTLSENEPGHPLPHLLAADDGNVVQVRWLTAKRLLLTIERAGKKVTQLGSGTDTSTRRERAVRVMAVDIDGGNARGLEPAAGEIGTAPARADYVIANRAGDADHILMLVQKDRYSEPAVMRVNVQTGDATLVRAAEKGVLGWIPDANGTLRAAMRQRDRGFQFLALREDGRLEELAEADRKDMMIQGIGMSPDTLMVSARDANGRLGLYEMPLQSGAALRPLVTDPQSDIGPVIRLNGRVIGVEMSDDHRRAIMIDPAMTAVQKTLEAASPGSRFVITDLSQDGRWALAIQRETGLPDIPMLVNTVRGDSHYLAPSVPDALRHWLGSRSVVTITARDGLVMSGILTLPEPRPAGPLPFIILPHQTRADRADLGFDWLAQYLTSRGYGVLQPNHRGSTGQGLAFQNAANGEWGQAVQDDLVDATRWAIDQGLADPSRFCIVGLGMGGYAAMVAAYRDPALYQCAVSINGFTSLVSIYDQAGTYSLGLTVRDEIGHNRDALATISPLRQVDRMQVPLLMIQGGADEEVPQEDSRGFAHDMVKANKDLLYVGLPNADHAVSRAEDRAAVLSRLTAFLAAMNPATPVSSAQPASAPRP